MTAPYEADHLAGEIVTDIYEEFWRKDNYRFGSPGVDYEMVGTDEGMELGLTAGDDPYWTVVRRKSDGQLFEIEIEVTALPIETPASRQEIPGQQEMTA